MSVCVFLLVRLPHQYVCDYIGVPPVPPLHVCMLFRFVLARLLSELAVALLAESRSSSVRLFACGSSRHCFRW